MGKKIKILHIINNLEIGGAERLLVLLLNNLAKLDLFEIHLISLEGHGILKNDLSDRVHFKEFKYDVFGPKLVGKSFPDFRLGLFNYVKKINPDIIHGHLFKAEDYAKVLGFLLNKPVIVTYHDILGKRTVKQSILNRHTTKAVAVSKIVRSYLEEVIRIPKLKIVDIPHTVDVSVFEKGRKKFDSNKPVFLYIGRLLESKGIDVAIKGLAKLRKDFPSLELRIYGKEVFPSYKKYLEDLISKNRWDFAKLMGPTNDVPKALSTGDIFLLPSETEGFAISVLEATSAYKPVIATDAGAITQLVANGKSGFIIEKNNPEQIYHYAKKILDENLVESFGVLAHKIAVEQYDISKICQQYKDLYLSVLE